MTREVIAFIGRQGSGKSFNAKKLAKEQGYQKISFADPLRHIAFNVIGMDYEEGMAKYDELKRTELFNGLTFRNILENLGSSVRQYDENFWATALTATIFNSMENVVIDDMRYPNEYFQVKTFCYSQGIEFKAYYCNYKSDVYEESNPHESAGLSNFLAQLGYNDLQLIKSQDVFKYQATLEEAKQPKTLDDILGNMPMGKTYNEAMTLLKRK